ncbi:hypothetical protein D3C84_536650 [compost metagenome]
MNGLQCHDRHQGFRIRTLLLFMQVNACRETFRRLGEHRRRTGVQAVRVGQRHRFGEQRLALFSHRLIRCQLDRIQTEQRLTTVYPPGFRRQPSERLTADHQHQGQQAACIQRNKISIELNQRLPDGNLLPLLHQPREPLSCKVHRVEPDVHQHLHAIFIGDADRMPTGLHIADHPCQRRAQRC